MRKVLLFGGTGHLGRCLAAAIKSQGYQLDLAVRNPVKAGSLKIPCDRILTWQHDRADTLDAIFGEPDIVISSLGKSVSPNARDKASFHEVDFELNHKILKEAIRRGVKKFVYISAFHSERYPDLEYFRVHEAFSAELQRSEIDFAIIKPTSLFSAYLEMIPLARKGALFTFGSGSHKTNPIAEDDVAQLAIKAIEEPETIIEAGGPKVYTRRELAEIIQGSFAPEKKVKRMPVSILKFFLPVIRLADRNLYDKLRFFIEVMAVDTIAPTKGTMIFEDFVRDINKRMV